jgi:hypothetical protein
MMNYRAKLLKRAGMSGLECQLRASVAMLGEKAKP